MANLFEDVRLYLDVDGLLFDGVSCHLHQLISGFLDGVAGPFQSVHGLRVGVRLHLEGEEELASGPADLLGGGDQLLLLPLALHQSVGRLAEAPRGAGNQPGGRDQTLRPLGVGRVLGALLLDLPLGNQLLLGMRGCLDQG